MVCPDWLITPSWRNFWLSTLYIKGWSFNHISTTLIASPYLATLGEKALVSRVSSGGPNSPPFPKTLMKIAINIQQSEVPLIWTPEMKQTLFQNVPRYVCPWNEATPLIGTYTLIGPKGGQIWGSPLVIGADLSMHVHNSKKLVIVHCSNPDFWLSMGCFSKVLCSDLFSRAHRPHHIYLIMLGYFLLIHVATAVA